MLKVVTLLAGLALWGGCSTPETRIQSNPQAFGRLTAEQQAQVKQGKVALGLDRDAVQLALGKPDRITERTNASGTVEIWHYVTQEYSGGPYYHYPGRYRRMWMDGCYPFLVNYPAYRERAQAMIFFRDGKVVAYEQRK